jgi:uncharacterized membrane protein HdeD (DUF308 family)
MRVVVADLETLTENWWVILLRGIAGILFGILTFLAPSISLGALVLLFGAFAFTDGLLASISALRKRREDTLWWALLLQGVLGIAAGVATLAWPRLSALALLYLIAAWAVLTGAFEIVTAIRLRKEIRGEWLLVLSGLLSIGLGVLLGLFPVPGALAVVLWIGAYALVSGALLVGLSLRLRVLGSRTERDLHADEPSSVERAQHSS